MPKTSACLSRQKAVFKLTPLYDIMSAHPLIASQQLERQKIKMAMALHGKNRHYHWHSLQPRHFLSTAEQVGLPIKTARGLFNDMLERVETAIEAAQAALPPDFPEAIAAPVFTGMRDRRDVGMRGV